MAPPKNAPTAQVEGEIVIRRPVEEVFDYVAAEQHEPTFNTRMSCVELLTPEPIGVGSRFGIEMTMMRRVFDMTVEFTAFERPRLLGSTSHSLPRGGNGRPLLTAGSLTFDRVLRGNTDALVVAGGSTGRDEVARAACGAHGSAAGATGLGQLEAALGGTGAYRIGGLASRQLL
jgi:uncharacterized protein YndB with AHSA1/START domain